MKYSLLNKELSKRNKSEILQLMKQLIKGEKESYYQEKVRLLESYIMNGSAIIYAALAENSIVGYVWGYIRTVNESERLHVTQLVVDKSYRCLGIGKELLGCIKEWGTVHGYEMIELNVLPANIGGIKFYLTEGYKCKSILMENDLSVSVFSGGVLPCI